MALLKHTAIGPAIPINDSQRVRSGPYIPQTGPGPYTPSTGTASSYDAAKSTAAKYKASTMGAASYKPTTGSAASYSAKTGTASSYDPTTYKADERQVQDSMVVENRLDKLIAKNSDYMKRAKTEGLQTANARGLLNTDFAVGAAHGAAIDRALPIAQQDAATYFNQQQANQQYSNTALRDNASFTNEADRFNAGNEQQMTMANMDALNTAGQFNAGSRQQMNLANMDAKNNAGQFNAANVQQANMANMNAYNDAGRFNASNQQQTNLANQDAFNQANQYNASNSQQMALANMDAQNNAAQFNATTAFNQWSQESQQQHAMVMENLTAENKDKLIRIEMDYKSAMENQKNASDAYREAIAQMGGVLSNTSLKGDQQDRAVGVITGQLESFLNFNAGFMGEADSTGQTSPVGNAAQNYNTWQEQNRLRDQAINQVTGTTAEFAKRVAANARANPALRKSTWMGQQLSSRLPWLNNRSFR